MSEVFLDSSVAIGLVFRHAGERAACQAALPTGAKVVCSRYVIFEVARGFLRRLIALHNFSLEYQSFANLHQAAYSGQRRFTYEMPTWLGAFTDYFATLEAEDGVTSDALKLEEFRAKLRGWIRRGWQRLGKDFAAVNEIACRDDLPPPIVRSDDRVDQDLPTLECGRPENCGLQKFIHARKSVVEAVAAGLESLPASQRDPETDDRIDSLRHLLTTAVGTSFEGKKCHRCGDALICIEAPAGQTIATKNRKHFEPLAKILLKPLVVAKSAPATT